MKPTLTLIILLCFTLMVKAQVEKTLELTAGSLKTILTPDELKTVTNLTITGTIDARDFKIMRDEMPVLAVVDMSRAIIAAYKGLDGPSVDTTDYYANEIPQDAFYREPTGKHSLRSVVIPLTTKAIGHSAFTNCIGLTSFNFPLTSPQTIATIGRYAFSGCINLSGTVTLPSGITAIREGTFSECRKLSSVNLPSSVDSIEGSAFYNCMSLKSLTLSSKLVYIGNYAFYNCRLLTGPMSLPSNLTTIGRNAFERCARLTSLIIPSSVKSIGEEAFLFCTHLNFIEVKHLYPQKILPGLNAFDGIDKTTTPLRVPYGTRSRYIFDYHWYTFKTIIEDTHGFLLNKTVLLFDIEGGSDSVELDANITWTATTDQTWLTVTPSSGDSSQTLTVTVEANRASDKSRNGTITLRGEGIPDQILQVEQMSSSTIIHLTPGGLSSTFTSEEKQSITSLALAGSMDARDFKTIHDEMPLLEILDISKVTIEAYIDTSDKYPEDDYLEIVRYPANTIPTAHGWNDDDLTKFALAGHPNLSIVKLPASLTSIGSWAFKYCSRLTTIEIPSSVTNIGMYAFFNCNSLTSIKIPPSITQLGDGTFSGCPSLKSVYCYPVNPPEMAKDYSFYGVFSIDTISRKILYVPYGTKERYKNAGEWGLFKNIVEMHGFSLSANNINFEAEPDSTSTIEILSGLPWTASSDQPWLTINPTFENESDTIAFTAAANNTNMGRIATVTVKADTISQTVTVFQKGLSTAINLKAGTLSTQFTGDEVNRINHLIINGEIDARDFKTMRDLMPHLSEIDLSHATIMAYSGVGGTVYNYAYKANEIPPHAFFSTEKLTNKAPLTSIQLPETATAINAYAFYNCTGLTNVKITSAITNIGNSAFFNCTALTAVKMSSSVTDIENFAFQGCTALTNIGEASVNNIGFYSFYGCNALTTINFSSTATRIEHGAFMYCSSLTSIQLPSTMMTIEENAFLGCISLKNVDIKSGVISIEKSAFKGCISLEALELPNSLSTIEPYLFSLSGLTSIVIPSSVTNIGISAFSGCQKLRSVTIPSSVSGIDISAFDDCTSLTSIYMYRRIPISGMDYYNPFTNVSRSACTVYVLYGTKPTYQTIMPWSEFENIVEMQGFMLSNDSIIVETKQGSSTWIGLSANVEWTASSNQPWLTVSPSSGNNNHTLTFTADANTADTARTATVTVSAPGTDPQTIVITSAWSYYRSA